MNGTHGRASQLDPLTRLRPLHFLELLDYPQSFGRRLPNRFLLVPEQFHEGWDGDRTHSP